MFCIFVVQQKQIKTCLHSTKLSKFSLLLTNFATFFDHNFEKSVLRVKSNNDKLSRNRKCKLANSEVITILILFHLSGFKTLKQFYEDYVCVHLRNEFPNVVSYNRFVELEKKATFPLIMFVSTMCMGKGTGISFIDSTKIAVCHNLRIHQNKVFKDFAQRGRTSTGWFYGFKLHLVINDKAEILSFQLTKGNVADNNENLLIQLCKDLFGKLYGDKGYMVKESVFQKLFYEGVHLITKIRKNMKSSLMGIADKIMLRKRYVIECVMDSLKNVCQLEHSRHRSIHGFIINIFSSIAAYHFLPKKPSITNHFKFEESNSMQLCL